MANQVPVDPQERRGILYPEMFPYTSRGGYGLTYGSNYGRLDSWRERRRGGYGREYGVFYGQSYWEVNHEFITDISNTTQKKYFFGRVQPGIKPTTAYADWKRDIQAGLRTPGPFMDGTARLGGPILYEFVGDYYWRIHVSPLFVYLGVVASDIVAQVEMFNAFFENVTISNIELINAEGVFFTARVGDEFKAIRSRQYEIAVTSLGPASIDAKIVVTFSNGTSMTIVIQGSRIADIDITPNWEEPVTVSLTWATDVFESFNGKEQRVSVREYPFLALSYRMTGGTDSIGRLDSTFYGTDGELFVPYWFDKRAIVAQSENTITVPHHRNVKVGTIVQLHIKEGLSEPMEVTGVDGDVLTLKAVPLRNYQGRLCIPCETLILTDELGIEGVTAEVYHANFKGYNPVPFRNPGNDFVFPLRDGLMMMPWRHNYSETMTRTMKRQMIVFDNGIASPTYLTKWDRLDETLDFKDVFLDGYVEIDRFWAWAYQTKGMATPFALRLNDNYFKLAKDILVGEKFIVVTSMAYSKLMANKRFRSDLTIFLKNGETIDCKTVGGVAYPASGTASVNLDYEFPRNIMMDEVAYFNFWLKGRHTSDTVELRYITPDRVKVSFSVRVVTD